MKTLKGALFALVLACTLWLAPMLMAQTKIVTLTAPPDRLQYSFVGHARSGSYDIWITASRLPIRKPFTQLPAPGELPELAAGGNLTITDGTGAVVFSAPQLVSTSWNGVFKKGGPSSWFEGTVTYRLAKPVALGPDGLTSIPATVRYTLNTGKPPSLSIDIDEFGANGLHVNVPSTSTGISASLLVW